MYENPKRQKTPHPSPEGKMRTENPSRVRDFTYIASIGVRLLLVGGTGVLRLRFVSGSPMHWCVTVGHSRIGDE